MCSCYDLLLATHLWVDASPSFLLINMKAFCYSNFFSSSLFILHYYVPGCMLALKWIFGVVESFFMPFYVDRLVVFNYCLASCVYIRDVASSSKFSKKGR